MGQDVHRHPESPWVGECPVCHGQLMRIHRRALAGGDPWLASLSLAGLSLAGAAALMLPRWIWPIAMILASLSLYAGLRRASRWQCRRCRTTFNHPEGADAAQLKTL